MDTNTNICQILYKYNKKCKKEICPFGGIVFNNKKIKMLNIYVYKNPRCHILISDKEFIKLLAILDTKGFINILYEKKMPRSIKDCISKREYQHIEYVANKDFSVFFPKDNLNTINYYYSNIKKRSITKTSLLKLIVYFNLYKFLCLIYSSNKCLVVQKKSENNIP